MNKEKYIFLLPLLLISSSLSAGEADLQSRVAQLERTLDGRGLLNILNELESLQQEVRELRGEVEQQTYTIDQMKKRQQNLYDDLDQRLPNPQGTSPDETAQISDESQPPAPVISPESPPVVPPAQAEQMTTETVDSSTKKSSSIVPVETYVAKPSTDENKTAATDPDPQSSYPQAQPEMEVGSDEENSYSEAFTLLKQGQHDKAVRQFRNFLQQHPGSQYADNAQYWLGEAYYAKRKFKTAIKEYKTLLRQYPDSGKASHALLKIGYCYDELGQKDFAQGELEDLIARYPGTSAANLAEERLALIRLQ